MNIYVYIFDHPAGIVSSGEVKPNDIIMHRMPLTDAQKHIHYYCEKRGLRKVF